MSPQNDATEDWIRVTFQFDWPRQRTVDRNECHAVPGSQAMGRQTCGVECQTERVTLCGAAVAPIRSHGCPDGSLVQLERRLHHLCRQTLPEHRRVLHAGSEAAELSVLVLAAYLHKRCPQRQEQQQFGSS